MVVPIANSEPDEIVTAPTVYVTLARPTASVTVGGEAHERAGRAGRLDRHVRCRDRRRRVSCTVTVNDVVEMLPYPSFAVTVTVVVPNPNVVPDAFE